MYFFTYLYLVSKQLLPIQYIIILKVLHFLNYNQILLLTNQKDKDHKKDHNRHINKKDNINKLRNLRKNILILVIGQLMNTLLTSNFYNNMKVS